MTNNTETVKYSFFLGCEIFHLKCFVASPSKESCLGCEIFHQTFSVARLKHKLWLNFPTGHCESLGISLLTDTVPQKSRIGTGAKKRKQSNPKKPPRLTSFFLPRLLRVLNALLQKAHRRRSINAEGIMNYASHTKGVKFDYNFHFISTD